MRLSVLAPACSLLLGGLLAAQEPPTGSKPQEAVPPLFASADPVELTIIGDLEAIRKDRADDPEERPAKVVLSTGDTLEAQLRPRGNFRRDPSNCSFPPLRLNLKKKGTKGTVFQGQDKLKIVAPCRPERDEYEQFVLLEYAMYKEFRLFTDDAFKVRLARITFVDTGGGRDPFTRSAFFIEDEDALAERMGGTIVDMPEGAGVRAGVLQPKPATLVAIFEYMIGNTDWSDQALHNVKLVQFGGTVRPVPYDFDFSGLVNTPYATPDPILGTRTVRERVYRGWCFDESSRAGLVDLFNSKRAEVEGMFATVPGLDEKHAKNAVKYLKGFFDAIETPDRAQRRMFRDCRAMR